MSEDNLVSADWLRAHLDDEHLVVVEIDNGTGNHASGHIPGAVVIEWETDLLDPVVRDVVDRAGFERLLSAKGIANDDTIVFYSGQSNWWAAAAYWYARMYGHADIRLLDGGRAKWLADGQPTTTEPTRRAPTDYRARDPRFTSRAYRDDVLAAIGGSTIVDVRSPEEYSGELLAARGMPQDHPQRRGHVPGAVNIPWTATINPDETFKSPSEIAAAYRAHGVDPADAGIVYCRMGWRSSHTWFALTELLGVEGVRNYDGSWNEYGMLTGVPIERAG